MPSANLTAVSVQKLRAPASGQIEYYDRRLPSFGLRISYRGTRSWFVMTRLHGKLIRVTLGRLPILSLADARDEARRVSTLAATGTDPRRVRAEVDKNKGKTGATPLLLVQPIFSGSMASTGCDLRRGRSTAAF